MNFFHFLSHFTHKKRPPFSTFYLLREVLFLLVKNKLRSKGNIGKVRYLYLNSLLSQISTASHVFICKKSPDLRSRFRLVAIQKSSKNPHKGFWTKKMFLSTPVQKFPCQPSFPTPSSLSFLKIPTIANLVQRLTPAWSVVLECWTIEKHFH